MWRNHFPDVRRLSFNKTAALPSSGQDILLQLEACFTINAGLIVGTAPYDKQIKCNCFKLQLHL